MIPCNNLKRSFEQYQLEFEEAVLKVLRSGWYVLGNECMNFESTFAKQVGAKHCVAVDNATNAIFLGIKTLGIGEGDEVIVQSNTYIATVLGITRNGATPIFVEPNEFYNMSEEIEKYITSKTKAVLVTHLFGQATKIDKIVEICKKRNIHLLEDCAQSHFAEFNGTQVGVFGDMGFFSFYPTKNIGAFGDAGAIVTNINGLDEKLRMMRNYGSRKRYDFEIEGINSRMDEIQAAILNVRLKHSAEITAEKITIAHKYLEGIKNPNVKLPQIDVGCTSVWHIFVMQVDKRDKFRAFLRERGVATDIHYPIPPHLSGCYKRLGYSKGDFPIAEYYAEHMVDIPCFNGMTNHEIQTVINAVNDYE